MFKPIWLYAAEELWGRASTSNVEWIKRKQNKSNDSCCSVWYVANKTLHADLRVRYIAEEIKSTQFIADIYHDYKTTFKSTGS